MFNFVRREIHSGCGFHHIGSLSRILMCLRTESLAFVPGPQCLTLLVPSPISSQTKLVCEEYLKSGEHLGTMAIVSSFFFSFFAFPSRHCHLDIVLHAFKCHPRPSAHFNSNRLLLCSDTS